ncbi:cell elongation-specific peptidoglycan biosynthesis regulator RodA [Sanguibacter gelidistatuariae]|uniref:Cell elongation-specific peptidoglycan biosynthesis regulator RodA n=1 Tax=Sanguibacter gelidistatuariae TaxID=1814289 RepID=A0A1G6H2A5_9MICO|nr:FtsW/RodA/SpoVE family cell cycle protein [Sanguibacter gelidistatuariae]SDB88427.1 cell elongation-specific peptidoglycan biosynthesis regulator RodA [Sanguibacter gelidistatuariae]
MATVEPGRVRSGRASELGLLVLALTLGVGAYALVGLGMEGSLPGNFYVLTFGMAALGFGLHFVVRWRAPYADPVLVPIAVGLNGLGLAMIYRLDLASQQLKGDDPGLATRQLGWTALGIIAAGIVVWVLRDHRTLRRYTYTAMIVGLVLVLLPLVPGLGKQINGARIWVGLGPFSLQPAEFAKIAFAVFFAGYLVTNRDTLTLAGRKVLGLQLPRVRDLGPIIVVWIASIAVLVLERDLGTSLLFFGLFVAMLYIATERISWVVIGLTLFAAGAVAAATSFAHVQGRFNAWLNAFDPEVFNARFGGSGQLVRGMFGMANGGLMGTGWGEGRPDLVPYAFSDFIFASLGEELGLTGIIALLVMYLVLVERGMRIAIGTRDGFGKLLAGGLAFVVAWQCFVVVGGVTRVIPLTGLTLPFLAYGGSSLLANWIIVALLLRISDNARRPTPLPLRGAPAQSPPASSADAVMPDDADSLPEEHLTPGVSPGVSPGDATEIIRAVDQ